MGQKEPSTIGPSSTLQTRKNTHNQKKERFEINQEEPSQQTNIKKMQTEQKTKRTIQKHN